VSDAADAYMLLAKRLADKGLMGQAFNFGNETPVSVLELVAQILSLMDKPGLQPNILNEARNEILKQYLDCSKSRKLLNWKPQHSLEDSLIETIKWYEKWFACSSNGSGNSKII
jgi:CDP-glucose 4,6-dehydratase